MPIVNNDINLPEWLTSPLYGCDGKLHSDEFLKDALQTAVQEENYELAAIYRDELVRRGVIKDERE